jgi:hypothetical protein
VDGVGGDLADGGPAIVAVFSEGFGNDEVADDEEHHEGDDEEECEPEKMSCVFEATHPTYFLPGRTGDSGEAVDAND